MVIELILDAQDQSSVTGMVGIQNNEGTTLAHMTSFTPAMGKKAMTIWQVKSIFALVTLGETRQEFCSG